MYISIPGTVNVYVLSDDVGSILSFESNKAKLIASCSDGKPSGTV